MAATKKDLLAKAARKAAAFTEGFDYDEFEYLATRGDKTVRLPLAVSTEQAAELGAIMERDDLAAFLELAASWGYPETEEIMRRWPTITAGAVVRGWLLAIEKAQKLLLGE